MYHGEKGVSSRVGYHQPPGDLASRHGPFDCRVGECYPARGGLPRPQLADSRFHGRAGRRDNGAGADADEAMMKREYVASPDDLQTADLEESAAFGRSAVRLSFRIFDLQSVPEYRI